MSSEHPKSLSAARMDISLKRGSCPKPGGCTSCPDPAYCRSLRIEVGVTTEAQEKYADDV